MKTTMTEKLVDALAHVMVEMDRAKSEAERRMYAKRIAHLRKLAAQQ